MRNKDQFNIVEKLLIAAFNLEKKGKRPFTAEDLVVSAWENFPDAFGLAGYQKENGELLYPDSNRVYAEIMGSKPIRKRGFLVKVGQKMYQLTEAGKQHTQLLLNRGRKESIKKIGLSREIERELKRLITSKAVDKVKNNRIEDFTFYDACTFLGISPRSSAIELEGRLNNFHKIIELTKKSMRGKEVTFEHGTETFGIKEMNLLKKVYKVIREKFHTELETISKRTDERV